MQPETTFVVVNSAEEFQPSFQLKQGYSDVNIPDCAEFFRSNKTITDYLKDQITKHFAQRAFSFVEEKDEFGPTNYLKNNRPLKVFVVQDLSNNVLITFVFDIAGCLI